MANDGRPQQQQESIRQPRPGTYYREIDGLRALAVALVVLFHLETPGFSGGFVGVDVFFTISGYIISRLIIEEVERTGRFNYRLFLYRRAKRIFPAMATVLLSIFWVGAWLFGSGDFERLGASVAHAIAGISNFYFWSEAGYFDPGSAVKPALHTWSLSVEAQFYLVWPLFLVALLKVRSVGRLAGLLVTCAASLYLSVFFSGDDASHRAALFFLMPFRAFEFGLGALAFYAERLYPSSTVRSEAIAALGLGLILYSAHIYTGGALYPSYYGLLPCAGTALAITGARTARLTGSFLRVPVVRRLGWISYSLYLVHWPVIVFARYTWPNVWNAEAKVVALGLSLPLALLLYHLVELPFRMAYASTDLTQRRRFSAGFSIAVLLISALGINAATQKGWRWRFPTDVREVIARTRASLGDRRVRDPGCTFTYLANLDRDACITPDPNRINILLLGDSVAEFAWVGLAQHLPEERYNLLQLTPSNCRPGYDWGTGECLKSNQFVFPYIAESAIDLTVIASLGPDLDNFKSTLRYLKLAGRDVLVVGQPFIFNGRLPDIIERTARRIDEIDPGARSALPKGTAAARRALQSVATESGANYFDIQERLCGVVDDYRTCKFSYGGSLITADNHHLTPPTAVRVFEELGSWIRSKYGAENSGTDEGTGAPRRSHSRSADAPAAGALILDPAGAADGTPFDATPE